MQQPTRQITSVTLNAEAQALVKAARFLGAKSTSSFIEFIIVRYGPHALNDLLNQHIYGENDLIATGVIQLDPAMAQAARTSVVQRAAQKAGVDPKVILDLLQEIAAAPSPLASGEPANNAVNDI